MRFYMYRALGNGGYSMENSNLASITGALWYLHKAVLDTCPRKFNITRLVRYLVTMENPASLGRQFGQYVQFRNGKCVTPGCSSLWQQHGYAVGCQRLNLSRPDAPNYAGPPEPVWYSLPGRCPSLVRAQKTTECQTAEPGGECSSPDGDVDCTWKAEPAGEISINELSNVWDYWAFCKAGGLEYNAAIDGGLGTGFWNGRADPVACRERVARVEQLFQVRYPHYPVTLGVPLCDSGR